MRWESTGVVRINSRVLWGRCERLCVCVCVGYGGCWGPQNTDGLIFRADRRHEPLPPGHALTLQNKQLP